MTTRTADPPVEVPTSAFDEVLAERRNLLSAARRLVRCAADADDLVQETLLRAFRARDRFQAGTSARAWATTILRRIFLSEYARRRRRRLPGVDADPEEFVDELPARARPATPAPWADALGGAAKRAIDRVPDAYRGAFCLAVFEDLTCREIADRLRIPLGTAMSRVHRARERLRRELVYLPAAGTFARRPSDGGTAGSSKTPSAAPRPS